MEHQQRSQLALSRRPGLTGRMLLAACLLAAAMSVAACTTPSASSSQPSTSASAVTSGQSNPATAAASPASQAPALPAAAASATNKLNLNTATREQFLAVPNVGDRMVREFLEYRPYTSIQQFRREIGKYVSQEQVAAYEQYVFVPVDPTSADAETLRQLPGVDADIASQLVSGRPYASTDAFLTKLGQYVSADQVAAARAYLTTP